MRRLLDVLSLDPIYGRIYEIISLEGRLPPADKIAVHDSEELKDDLPDSVLGGAWGNHDVWFREYPPAFSVFAHELIHLAKKYSDVHEEVYAYDLSDFIVLLAERGIMPKANPLRLFEDVSLKDLADAISRYYGIDGKSPIDVILNYFFTTGVIPLFANLNEDWSGLVLKENFGAKDIVIHSLVEIIESALYDNDTSLKLLLELLNSKAGL